MTTTEMKVRRGARRVFLTGVRMTDPASGTIWTVVPERVEGRPGLVYFSEEVSQGMLPRLSLADRDQMAILALRHLAGEKEGARRIAVRRNPPTLVARSTMPPDAELLQVIRDALALDASVRNAIASAFGVSVNTADKWYRYARGRPGADLPAPRRGRPPGRKNLKPKEES